jgi:hypothetical protein
MAKENQIEVCRQELVECLRQRHNRFNNIAGRLQNRLRVSKWKSS